MTLHRAKRKLLAAVLTLAIAGCANLREAERSDLGVVRENRPGDIYAQMGQEYMKVGQPAVALRKLKRGLSLDPDNGQVHAALGLLYQRLGEQQLAGEHYHRAIEIEPQNSSFRNAWGGFLCQRGEYDNAEAEFRLALSNPLYNQPWDAQTNAGVCALLAGRNEIGERYLRQALTANPRIPLALLRLAQLQAARGKYAEAREYLIRHGQIIAPSPQSLLLQCQVNLGLGDKIAAAHLRDEMIKHFPDAPETQTARRLVSP